jgi:MinD-like ATPase involved in chromosome partitioning or flagellar assembly
MTSELYDLFEKKTGILVNKVIADYLSSEKERKKFNKHVKSVYHLPVLATIPCYCEVLRAAGDYIFSEEKPDHPFAENLDKLANKLEKF